MTYPDLSGRDLSGGLPIEKESVIQAAPTEPYWSENLLFSVFDPANDLALWLHLGTRPEEWTLWEDHVFVALPGDGGVLSLWSYHKTAPERRPAGAVLEFKCVEPFKLWKVTFDGYAQLNANADMWRGRAPDGRKVRLIIDVEMHSITPAWDAHASATGDKGHGGMNTQGWAKEHYEQLVVARGRVTVEGKTYDYSGTGWRDHSRGVRVPHAQRKTWGGHMIASAVFPSGRSFVCSTYWDREGIISLEGGAVMEKDGAHHDAAVVERPRLRYLQARGERLPVGLRWDGGELSVICASRKSVWVQIERWTLGKDLDGPGHMYVLDYGSVDWDGETGAFYIERSEPLNVRPENIRPA